MKAHIPQEQISAWLDAQLLPAEAERVSAHVQYCPECGLLHQELASTTRLYRDLEAIELPSQLWSKIEAELILAPHPSRFTWLWSLRSILAGRQALAAAAVLLVVVALGAITIVRQDQRMRSQTAALAQIDLIQQDFANSEARNPFRQVMPASRASNPFTRRAVDRNSNPFKPARQVLVGEK
jgi:anti-sigma factor RsiW